MAEISLLKKLAPNGFWSEQRKFRDLMRWDSARPDVHRDRRTSRPIHPPPLLPNARMTTPSQFTSAGEDYAPNVLRRGQNALLGL